MKTVVLFFEKGASTTRTWYYQLDPGRSLGKTNPLDDDDLGEFVNLQTNFADSDKSWSIKMDDIDQRTFDLSVKNPNKNIQSPLRAPDEIIADMMALDRESARVLKDVRSLL